MRPGALAAATLALAQERSPTGVCERLAVVLASQDGAALARVWTLDADGATLGLVASAGAALDGTPWRRTDGAFARVPVGVGKIGKVAASGAGMLLHDMSARSMWIAHPEWAAREELRSFAAHPLSLGGVTAGVVAAFSRARIDADAFAWLRSLADHAAAALATTRTLAAAERRATMLAAELADRLEPDVALARGTLVAESAPMHALVAQIAIVAPTGAPVLLVGERGTGKELVARRIHAESRRAAGPFVRLPPGELADATPRLAAADGGTAFLDDVAAASTALQRHVARLVERRAGDGAPDVRVVAATRAADAATLEPELRVRLGVCRLDVPPLRDRADDLPALVARLVADACARFGREPLVVRADDLRTIARRPWPGNVRELAAAIEWAVGRTRGGRLRLDLDAGDDAEDRAVVRATEWRLRERANVEAALARADGRIYGPGGAAALLGVPPTTLASRMKALGISSRRAR